MRTAAINLNQFYYNFHCLIYFQRRIWRAQQLWDSSIRHLTVVATQQREEKLMTGYRQDPNCR